MIRQIIIIFSFIFLLNANSSLEKLNSKEEPFYIQKDGKIYSSQYITESPKIDGLFLESYWIDIEDGSKDAVISDFVQDEPNNMSLTSSSTHVMIVYDENNIYIAAKLFDSDPDKIEGRLSKRDDFDPELSDWFSIEFDPDHDHQSGYFFAVNAAGIQSDAVIHSESDLDFEYDAIWDAATVVDEDGWRVEMRIPFKMMSITQLKNPWGLNIGRFIYRYNEMDRWVALDRDFVGRSSHYGHLVGLTEMDIKRSIDFQPYILGCLNKFNNIYLVDEQIFADSIALDQYNVIENPIGLDIKFRISPSTSLDLTINPDFGQVEMDPKIINLSAYEVYLPEKRIFFNEISSLFNTPVDIFYSRRIGGPVQGRANKITSATRFFGKASNGYEYGFILANTIPQNNSFDSGYNSYYFAGRAVKELFNQTSVIGLSTTNFIFENDRSTVIAFDGANYLLSNNLILDYQIINSLKNDSRGNGFIFDAEYYQFYPFSVNMSLDVFDKNIDINDVGYLFRNNIKEFDIEIAFEREDPALNIIRKSKVSVSHERSQNFDSLTLKDSYGIYAIIKSMGYNTIILGYNHNKQHYDDLYMFDYEQDIVSPHAYLVEESSHLFFYFSNDIRRRLSYNIDFQFRESINTDKFIQYNSEFIFNASEGFLMSFAYNRADSQNRYDFLEIVEDDEDSDINHYIFANSDGLQNRYSLRVEKYFNKDISLQIYSEYLSHSEKYTDYKEWLNNEMQPIETEFISGNYETNVLPLYTTGDLAPDYEIIDGEIITEQYLNPNYYIGFFPRYTSLDFNLSFKWEYARGSELYFIYKLSRAVNGQSFNSIIDFINYSGSDSWTEKYFDNAFYIKLNYWFNV